MKKIISSVLIVAAMMTAGTVKADNITLEQAKAAAAYYLGHVTSADKLSAADLELVYQIDNVDMGIPAVYFFRSHCGWIIMAGTTVNDPVIAYSTENNLDMDNLPENMMWWVNSYAEDVKEIQALDAENDYPDSPEWETIVNQKLPGAKSTKVILLDSKWDQGSTNAAKAVKSYNRFCPRASNGKYSVTGCVATALSQMCYYYQYPVRPKSTAKTWFGNTLLKVNLDTVSYDYSIMPTRLNTSSDSASIAEVAKLCYHVGLAVKMQYDPEGSSSNNYYAQSGMTTNFKYQNPTPLSRQNTDDTAFVNTVRRELGNSDVVYMTGKSSVGSGADAAGHAWLVTGYEIENSSYMYFNWGWGGSGNAWFNLRANNMYISSQGYNFDTDQSILLGLMPPADSNIHHSNPGSIAGMEDNTVLGTAYPNPVTLSVSLPYNTNRDGEMNVYSIDGKLVASRRVQAGNGQVELKVTGMPAGIYIYRLNSQSGKFMVR